MNYVVVIEPSVNCILTDAFCLVFPQLLAAERRRLLRDSGGIHWADPVVQHGCLHHGSDPN